MSTTYQVHEEEEFEAKVGNEEDGRPAVVLVAGHHDIRETSRG